MFFNPHLTESTRTACARIPAQNVTANGAQTLAEYRDTSLQKYDG